MVGDRVRRALDGRTDVRALRGALTRFRGPLIVLSTLAAGLVFWIAVDVFPYHSINHDEGVYLQQAAMLLDGRLWLTPPVPDAVRPWFFVQDGGRLYPKYSPVPAALFGVGVALDTPRLALALIAAGNAALVGLLSRAAFDRRVGLLAVALLLTAPMFLVTSAVFLPYAPTTLLNLVFAFGYVRTLREGSTRAAILTGVAVGLAFFARPYTALLFAAPFILHAVYTLWSETRSERFRVRPGEPLTVSETAGELFLIAVLGTGGVLVTLAYNWLVTGSPFVFPYAAFAPLDGPGFGHRQILSHETNYTPSLALRSNARVLWQLAIRWGPLGAFGTVAAAIGLVHTALQRHRSDTASESAAEPNAAVLPDHTLRLVFAGLFLSVTVGNVFFWGNFNVLAGLEEPNDGLIAYLGPFYHFDLLLPLSAFAAAGLSTVGRRITGVLGSDRGVTASRFILAVIVLVSIVGAGVVHAGTVDRIVDRNEAYTENVEPVYEGFEERSFDNGLIFTPTPYGDWLAHPFQYLRNDPSLDGDRVFVLDRDAERDFAALDAFPERQPYRFTYRGDWPPAEDERVTAVVRPLEVREGERVRVTARMGVVVGAQSATVRIATDNESVQYGVEQLPEETLPVTWILTPEKSRVVSENLHRYSDASAVPIDGARTVTMSVTFVQPGGSTITYVHEISVSTGDETIRAITPPEQRVCRLTADCGREGTYVEGGEYPSGVALDTSVTVENETGS